MRDTLLGRASDDIDIALEGDAVTLAHAVQSRWGGEIKTHERFRTATWHPTGSDIPVDLITARSETYSEPAALPIVTPSTLRDDLARRDFTINTLTYFPDTDEIVDLWNGQNDLNDGLIRILHDQSFVDDPTRAFRAVRYAQRYQFEIDPRTSAMLARHVDNIQKLSGDRIRHELEYIFRERWWGRMLEQLDDLDVLRQIVPKLHGRFPNHIPATNVPNVALLAWLSCQTGMVRVQTAERLNLNPSLWEDLSAVAHIQSRLENLDKNAPPSQVAAVFDENKRSNAREVVRLLTTEPHIASWIVEYDQRWRNVKPFLTGQDLIEMGLRPSPYFRTILSDLRAAQLDGNIKSKQTAKKIVKQLIDEQTADVP